MKKCRNPTFNLSLDAAYQLELSMSAFHILASLQVLSCPTQAHMLLHVALIGVTLLVEYAMIQYETLWLLMCGCVVEIHNKYRVC